MSAKPKLQVTQRLPRMAKGGRATRAQVGRAVEALKMTTCALQHPLLPLLDLLLLILIGRAVLTGRDFFC